MPTTFTGLLMFVVLLLPGFVYTTIRERNVPRRERSAFRETVEIGMVSVLAIVAVLVSFAILHFSPPVSTPDVGQWIDEGGQYFETHYVSVAAWSLGLLSAATLGAGFVAWKLSSKASHPSTMSSWWYMFDANLEAAKYVYVGCEFEDGSWIDGLLKSYNNAESEGPDRDLILVEPINYRPAGIEKERPYEASAVCLSARHIAKLFMTIVEPNDEVVTTSASSELLEPSEASA